MENQHRHITGYRELTAEDIAAMNEIKRVAETVADLVSLLHRYQADQRWTAIGVTQLQQGFMALTRAVAQPTTF